MSGGDVETVVTTAPNIIAASELVFFKSTNNISLSFKIFVLENNLNFVFCRVLTERKNKKKV